MKNKTIPVIFLICLFLYSCSLTPNTKIYGIANLDKRQEVLKVGVTNKNDVIQRLGETILKDQTGNENWAYIETVETKNIFGTAKIVKNNVLVLIFDNKGVLSKKKYLNINDLNELKIDQSITSSNAINDSFSKKLFSSMRKRMQNKKKELNP